MEVSEAVDPNTTTGHSPDSSYSELKFLPRFASIIASTPTAAARRLTVSRARPCGAQYGMKLSLFDSAAFSRRLTARLSIAAGRGNATSMRLGFTFFCLGTDVDSYMRRIRQVVSSHE